MNYQELDWNKLSNDKKRSLSKKKGLVFVAGGREMSKERVKKLIEEYGVEGNYLLFGVPKETFIPELEFEQFRSLKINIVTKALDAMGELGMGKVRTIEHRHEDIKYVISELSPLVVVFIQGSYKRAIHLREEYWKALDIGAEIIMESPFLDKDEARKYLEKQKRKSKKEKIKIDKYKIYTDKELLNLAEKISRRSYDWTGSVGAVLARKGKPKVLAHNVVLPNETNSLLNGSLREKHRSPAGDQNYYDTNHAEMEIVEKARRRRVGLRGKTLYINIFPCPACTRMISRTEISRIVYSIPHSDSSGAKLLKKSGIKVEQVT